MKPVKTFLYVVVLLFALAVNTFAGEQQTPGYANPQPSPSPTNVMSTSTEADDSTYDPYAVQSGETAETSDYYLFFDVFTALLYSYPMY